jgi:putative heme iron utilization protein
VHRLAGGEPAGSTEVGGVPGIGGFEACDVSRKIPLMDRNVLTAIAALLQQRRVLSLAVLVEGSPEAALLPFALRADYGAVYVQASGLARHARGLQPGARVGLLVHENDLPEGDPMQLPRLSVQATVDVIDEADERFAPAAARFAQRFPQAEMTLAFGDFNLYELTLGRGRYVEGFARAFNVGPDTFGELSSL